MTPEKKCPTCGKRLAADAPMGLCPDCLLEAGVGSVTFDTDGGARASLHPPPLPDQIAPHFPQLEILGLLGRGGMGVVYKARQKSLDRLVAVKLLAPERVFDPRFAERFSHEARALAALNHPHIVTVYDFGVVDVPGSPAGGLPGASPESPSKLYFLLMEFVDGANLRQLLGAQKFTPEEALAIVPPICEALQYAHEHGIVHRDIKPENLLLDKGGRVKIADFGIAKILGAEGGTGVVETQTAGTPQYMAPEQRTDATRVDHRADIYSLGVVLYEMLTGELPGKPLAAPSSRMRGLQIDVRLDEIVLRALEQEPGRRYQNVGEVKTMVETVTTTAPPPPAEPSHPAPAAQGAFTEKPGIWRAVNQRPRVHAAAIPSAGRKTGQRLLGAAFAIGIVALGILAMSIALKPTSASRAAGGSQGSGDLADSPFLLQKLSTAEVIRVGVAKPISPWAWQELDRRPLTATDAAQIFEGLLSWLQREHPAGFTEPLNWLNTFLGNLKQRGLWSDEQAVHFMQVLEGKVRCEPMLRLREGARTLDLRAECRNRWCQSLLGLEMMNQISAVTVDGQPVKLHEEFDNWNAPDLYTSVPLPPLAPGKHAVNMDVSSAFVPEGNLIGLNPNAPSSEWPPAKKNWTRTATMELVVYPPDAVIVGQTQVPALNPVTPGALSIKQAIVRSRGHQAQALLVFNVGLKLPVAISFDVTLRAGNQSIPCGALWASKELSYSDSQIDTRGSEQLTAALAPLSADIKEADIVLTPNPKYIEHVGSVDEIWGHEIVFSHVPLSRQDREAAVANPQASSRPIHPAEIKDLPLKRQVAREQNPSFGPVIERVIKPANPARRALNLVSGSFVTPGPGRQLDFKPDGTNSLRAAGADLYAEEGAPASIIKTLNMHLCASLSPSDKDDLNATLDTIKTDELGGALAELETWRTTIENVGTPSFNLREPLTSVSGKNLYLFSTWNDVRGVLQITDLTENPTRITIRYKLLQDGHPSADLSATPAHVHPVSRGKEPRPDGAMPIAPP